jgi:flagellar motility protein MotE (MotC chaperone)
MLRKHPAERPDAATVGAVLRRVANGARGANRPAAAPSAARAAARGEPPAAARAAPQATPRAERFTPLEGMPALDAAKIVSDWPTDRAVTDLLSLGETAAAGIINRCADPVAGKLLSGIAAGKPARARKILEMVTTERAGRLLDQMSSLAAASALSLPSPTGAVRMLGHADDLTAAGVLLEMSAPSAAGLITAMDAERAAKLLGQAAPVTVAAILRNVPGDRRRLVLNQLTEPFRALVAGHLERAGLTSRR